MTEVVVVVLALVAAWFVAVPLRRGKTSITEAVDEVAEADAEKRAKLGALVELEEERIAGKLSETDFELLQRQYESEAIAALQRLDSLGDEAPAEDDLEAEIARVRSRLRCPACGAPRQPAARCPECGA